MKSKNGISRRAILQVGGATAAAGALAFSRVEAAAKASGATRTLALIGDRYHNPDYIRVSLNRLFKELELPIDFTTNYNELSSSLLKPYQLFICLRDNMIWPNGYPQPSTAGAPGSQVNLGGAGQEKAEYWATEEQGQTVKDFVAAGNGFYSYHNNAFVSRSSKNYREVQGGLALSHPPLRPFQVRIVNKEHPITQGVEDFMVTDEQHYLIYDKDPKNVLLSSVNLEGLTFQTSYQDGDGNADGVARASRARRDLGTTTVSGWAHEYGKGRVVFTAMGHTIDAMWQPQHLKLQKNAVRWLLKQT